MAIGIFATPRRFREKTRQLPGLVYLLGGVVLIWSAMRAPDLAYNLWMKTSLVLGSAIFLIGAVSPLFLRQCYLYMSHRRIKLYSHPPKGRFIQWDKVENIDFSSDSMDIIMRNGHRLHLTPLEWTSTSLRSRIDSLSRECIMGKQDREAPQSEQELLSPVSV